MEVLMGLSQGTIVAGFVAGGFSYAVLRPIYAVLADVKQAIAELRAELRANENERKEIDKRLVRIEEKVKALEGRYEAELR